MSSEVSKSDSFNSFKTVSFHSSMREGDSLRGSIIDNIVEPLYPRAKNRCAELALVIGIVAGILLLALATSLISAPMSYVAMTLGGVLILGSIVGLVYKVVNDSRKMHPQLQQAKVINLKCEDIDYEEGPSSKSKDDILEIVYFSQEKGLACIIDGTRSAKNRQELKTSFDDYFCDYEREIELLIQNAPQNIDDIQNFLKKKLEILKKAVGFKFDIVFMQLIYLKNQPPLFFYMQKGNNAIFIKSDEGLKQVTKKSSLTLYQCVEQHPKIIALSGGINSLERVTIEKCFTEEDDQDLMASFEKEIGDLADSALFVVYP